MAHSLVHSTNVSRACSCRASVLGDKSSHAHTEFEWKTVVVKGRYAGLWESPGVPVLKTLSFPCLGCAFDKVPRATRPNKKLCGFKHHTDINDSHASLFGPVATGLQIHEPQGLANYQPSYPACHILVTVGQHDSPEFHRQSREFYQVPQAPLFWLS